jgi:hypothetical protein
LRRKGHVAVVKLGSLAVGMTLAEDGAEARQWQLKLREAEARMT